MKLLTRIPGFSVDELLALRDAVWFGKDATSAPGDAPVPRARRPLHAYLRALAREYLTSSGAVARTKMTALQGSLASGESPAVHARQAFRWLTFALPSDLLLAAMDSPLSHVELLSPAIARTLKDDGYAESHMHLGAGLDFPTLWSGTLQLMLRPELTPDFFKDPGAEFDGGSSLSGWLIRAALARFLLGTFLVRRTPAQTFTSYLARLRPAIIRTLGITGLSTLRTALFDLRTGQLSPSASCAALREVYAQLTLARLNPTPKSLEDWSRADPLWPRLGGAPEATERAYVARSLAYLRRTPSTPAVSFAELFWQTVRIRCGLYRYVVQRPMTPGLQWFVRFYGRMARARGKMPDDIKLASAAKTCGLGEGLRALEVRTAPEASASAALKQWRLIAESARRLQEASVPRAANCAADGASRDRPLEIGLVYHFCKERGEPGPGWRGSSADPSLRLRLGRPGHNLSGVRYGTFFRQQAQRARALVWVLHHFPQSVELIRGVDVCTDELGVPNWVLAPLLRYVRVSALTAQRRRGLRNYRFGTTAHAGEDFIHLLTGLRNLDEAIEGYGLGEGDRIGHGLALGVEPEEWSRRAGKLAVLREDRILDLAWVWWSQTHSSSAQVSLPHLEKEMREHAEYMFAQRCDPYELLALARGLKSETALRKAGFPQPKVQTRKGRLGFLQRYLTDPEVFKRGRETVWVDPTRDQQLLYHLQGNVRQKAIARGIVIEVNPSSNLLIGDYGNLSSHPLWRLRPPKPDPQISELSICIGSDDPAVFASNIREEYQWVTDAMVTAGISEEEARRWLTRTRQCGLETRFTIEGYLQGPSGPASPRGPMPPAPLIG